jgi:hypothetical protein
MAKPLLPVVPVRTLTLAATLVAMVVGCGGEDSGEDQQAAAASPGFGGMPTAGTGTSSKALGSVPAGTATNVALGPVDPATMSHPEVVELVMSSNDGMTWFCTGALVSSTVVVTAGHCLQTRFTGWTVIAATLEGRPRVKATPSMYDAQWEDVAHPDLGIVRLASPIELPRYAELTDVTAAVDGGQARSVQTIVRTKELPEAPLMRTKELALSSTISSGYLHGYGVPLYSHGGDSGAGMFLVENGEMTHKLVGVEREPDPQVGIDHLSRIDASFIAWVAAGGAGAAAPAAPADPAGTTDPAPTTTTTTTKKKH